MARTRTRSHPNRDNRRIGQRVEFQQLLPGAEFQSLDAYRTSLGAANREHFYASGITKEVRIDQRCLGNDRCRATLNIDADELCTDSCDDRQYVFRIVRQDANDRGIPHRRGRGPFEERADDAAVHAHYDQSSGRQRGIDQSAIGRRFDQ